MKKITILVLAAWMTLSLLTISACTKKEEAPPAQAPGMEQPAPPPAAPEQAPPAPAPEQAPAEKK